MSRDIFLKTYIYTPEGEVYSGSAISVSCQTTYGQITILAHHLPLLSLLDDGIITIKEEKQERYFSAGSGYVETDGKEVRVLISRAYGQDEIDEKRIKQVQKEAQALLKNYKDKKDRDKAMGMLRRVSIDLGILKKTKRKWRQ